MSRKIHSSAGALGRVIALPEPARAAVASAPDPARSESWFLICAVLASWLVAGSAGASASLPVDIGEGVATCSSAAGFLLDQQPDEPVVGVWDLRSPPEANRGAQWAAPEFSNSGALYPDDEWVNRNLGEVFGTAIDNQTPPNIYVAATSLYGYTSGDLDNYPYGPRGPGAVYRLDGLDGRICVVAQLDVDQVWETMIQTDPAPSLGDLAFDPDHSGPGYTGQLFVSNLDDGFIYIIHDDTTICTNPHSSGPDSGLVWASYDHAGPDLNVGLPGFPELGHRVFGLAYANDTLFYSVWWEDEGAPDPNEDNEVWSLSILPSGFFDGASAQLEFDFDLDPTDNSGTSMPITGLSILDRKPPGDPGFQLLASERSIKVTDRAFEFAAHDSSVAVFEVASDFGFPWVRTRDFFIGTVATGDNAAGGSDFANDDSVWSTGDQLKDLVIYGLQRTPAVGNTFDGTPFGGEDTPSSVGASSFFIDLNGTLSNQDKTQIGDIAIHRSGCGDPAAPLVDTFEGTGPDDPPPGLAAWTTSLHVHDDLESYTVGTSPVYGPGFKLSSAGHTVGSFGYTQHAEIYEGQSFQFAASKVTIEFDSPVQEAGFGIFDANYAGYRFKLFDSNDVLLEDEAEYDNILTLAGAGGAGSEFVGFVRTKAEIKKIVYTTAPGDPIAIDNIRYCPAAPPATPALAPPAVFLLAVLLLIAGVLKYRPLRHARAS